MNTFNQQSQIIKFSNNIEDLHMFEGQNCIILQLKDGQLELYPNVNFRFSMADVFNTFFALENKNWETINFRKYEKQKLKQLTFKNIQWEHNEIKMFGKTIYEPRFSAWYGDKVYTYSGAQRTPYCWTKELLQIKQQVEQIAKQEFNSVLLNWYRDGQDSMGMHADDEKELGKNPLIASISFGATRTFILHRKKNIDHKLNIQLTHSSILLMKGGLQHHWKHGIPKQRKITEPRVNLTFRKVH